MRIDRASRVVAAPRNKVFEALVTKEAVLRWLPPAGAQATIDKFEPRGGGAFRMTLVFSDGNQTKRKTTKESDTVEGKFLSLVPPERIEQQFTFVSDDPRFAGIMLMTWQLSEELKGTRVTVIAKNVPEGITREDHQAGMDSSLTNLSSYVEANCG